MQLVPKLPAEEPPVTREVFTSSFLDDVAELPERVESVVWEKVSLASSFPGVGSSLVEPSLRAAFGPDCLKVNAAGYDVLYDYDRQSDAVCFLGIVHQRAVR